MTETASQCTINPFDAPKVGSAGKPFETDVRIMVDGKIADEPNQIGEIVVRGDHVISSYMDPHPESFEDGWLLTGDLGYFDEDGYLFVKDRKKDIINHGGEKVAPAQVENSLSQLDFVNEFWNMLKKLWLVTNSRLGSFSLMTIPAMPLVKLFA